MGKYTVTLQIDVLVDVEISAISMEEALEKGRQLRPENAIKPRTKKNSIVDWETKAVTSVFEQ
jgi:hypothetical protein